MSFEWEKLPDVEVVGYAYELDLEYQFCEFLVLRKSDVYYWASDSGCSCPTPFEYHSFPGDFKSGNVIDALNALTEWSKGGKIEDNGLRTALMNAPTGTYALKDAA